jgi:hypothetical protein
VTPGREGPGRSDAGTGGELPDAADSTALTAGGRVETVVPAGDDPVVCERCGRPFPRDREDLLALHRGLAHWSTLAPAERSAYDDALAAEDADLRRFRIVALGLLVLLYFGFLFAFALFT